MDYMHGGSSDDNFTFLQILGDQPHTHPDLRAVNLINMNKDLTMADIIRMEPHLTFEELIYDMMNHDMQLFGQSLPESALSYLPGGKLVYPEIQKYPDIEMQKKTSASHPEMVQGITSPTHGG